MRKIETRTEDFIEFAEATKNFANLAFYEDVLKELNARQARIDALMLEYCPDDMTKEQFDNWAKHQSKSCPDCPHIIGDIYDRDCCFPDCVK